MLAIVFGLGQLLLPAIATRRLRASLSRHGVNVRVSVSAFPAVELLFGYADSVTVRIARLNSGRSSTHGLLASIEKVGRLDAKVGELDTSGLVLTDVSLTKRGAVLTAQAHVTRSAIEAILPVDFSVAPARGDVTGIAVRASADVLGEHVSATADVAAIDGEIQIQPHVPIVGDVSALNVVVFSDPSLWVDRVSALARGSSYALTATARYR